VLEIPPGQHRLRVLCGRHGEPCGGDERAQAVLGTSCVEPDENVLLEGGETGRRRVGRIRAARTERAEDEQERNEG